MKKLGVAAAAIAVGLVGCGSPLRSKPVDDTVIDHLATCRCMVLTNFGDREFTYQYTKEKIKHFRRLGYKKSVDQLTQALYLQTNGGPKSIYDRVVNNWQSKDCKEAVISNLAVEFSSEKAAKYTMVMMADGFFDEGREKLSKPIYRLCSEDYKGMCD